MYQTIEQTTEEQKEMYMKLPKEELIQMLIEANRNLRMRNPVIVKSAKMDDLLGRQLPITIRITSTEAYNHFGQH